MKFIKICLVVIVSGVMLACATPEEKAYESQTAVNEERLDLIEQYKACAEKAEKNKTDGAECEKYLKATDALK